MNYVFVNYLINHPVHHTKYLSEMRTEDTIKSMMNNYNLHYIMPFPPSSKEEEILVQEIPEKFYFPGIRYEPLPSLESGNDNSNLNLISRNYMRTCPK